MKNRTILSQFKEIEELLNRYPNLTEIMCNPDGIVWIENAGTVIKTEYILPVNRVFSIIRLLAGYYDLVINKDNPSLSVKIPVFNGGRFQALVPPVVESPVFLIRLQPKKVFTLDDLLAMGNVDSNQYEILEQAVLNKQNILFAGGTGSGKTTILNALLSLIKDDRIIVIEDNPEIKTESLNTVYILTNNNFSLRNAVKDSLRLRPDRIIIGEIRDGGSAIDLCKAWLTGHPGGLGTIHAASADSVHNRLYSLMQEEVVKPSDELIKLSIDMIVFVKKLIFPDRIIRKVTEII